jgi:hypothetical protein
MDRLTQPMAMARAEDKQRRRSAIALVGAYHEARLAELLEHVREGFARYDAGEIDAFDLDDLIHRYKRSAQKLWAFCSGVHRAHAGAPERRERAAGLVGCRRTEAPPRLSADGETLMEDGRFAQAPG